jgi:hypothetical protein
LLISLGTDEALTILKEAGPEIFVQSHLLIASSGSFEAEPSNEMLSVSKVIISSGPAIAIGALLFSSHPEHDFSFFTGKKKSVIGE